ncbi:MAG: hypothetical protein NTX50_31075 [Candidatus Sumerlaeota bacterium]|nr:hypothetical protein [Candidatus Sumerlaeota bacterium]
MKSLTTPDFWNAYAALPSEIKALAKRVYQIWKANPRHPSLCFKKCGDLWTVRIGAGYRALALMENGALHWFWIGTHKEYERLLNLS